MDRVFTVTSVGVNDKGDAVIRIVVNGLTTVVSTNVMGFALLAARGVPVVNGGK